jgi:hypothetical protein
MQPETVQPFSLAVSEVVRAFIERSFPVRAAHQTTEEFLRLLTATANGPLAAYREELAQFLDQCDLAKFARWSLSLSEMQTLFESARRFILAAGSVPPQPQPQRHGLPVSATLSPAHP